MIHYCKGEFVRDVVCFDPASSGFRHGSGFFETIAYNGNELCHLESHLDRLHHSLRSYHINYEGVDYPAIINEVITRNNLEKQFVRVNIVYLAEDPVAQPIITAAPFERKPYKAYRLALCSDKHISALNAHKTTSYMFYSLAHRQAQACGFDDCALFDFDDNLLESTTGAIVLRKGNDLVKMDTPYRLPSTALGLAETVLDIIPRVIHLDDLTEYRHAYILTSLVGMRPIVTIGEVAFVPDEEACRTATEAILLEAV